MRFLIPGASARDEAARLECLRRKHTLPDHGPWDAVLLPLPVSQISEDCADQLPPGQRVICGRTDAAFDCLSAKRRWRLCRVLEDESFTLENAALSAEGALYAAMREREDAIRGAECLVIGYGRIGKQLTHLLRALGAQVTVAARRPESRKEAGEGSIPLTLLSRALPDTQIVFNTVPANILTESQLSFLPDNALYLELASPPYGIPPENAKHTKAKYLLEGGIPGRYCPRSAAALLIDYAERTVNAP